MQNDLEPAVSPRLTALRGKIRIICHVIRAVTVGYPLFVLWGLYEYWSDWPNVVRGYANFYKLDISGASAQQHAMVICISIAIWVALALLCWFVWRLFGAYLRAPADFERGM